MDLNQFDAFEIHPCTLLNDQGQPAGVNYEPCEPGDPDLAAYVLYGHTPGKGVTALADFASEALAEMFRSMLSAHQRAAAEPLYAAMNMSPRRVDYRLRANGPQITSNTFYSIVSEEADVCTDLDWAARQVIDARHEFNNPHIQLCQLVPVDPAVARAALAQAEKDWAEDNDDDID